MGSIAKLESVAIRELWKHEEARILRLARGESRPSR